MRSWSLHEALTVERRRRSLLTALIFATGSKYYVLDA